MFLFVNYSLLQQEKAVWMLLNYMVKFSGILHHNIFKTTKLVFAFLMACAMTTEKQCSKKL
jgi:hypothetical protein